MWLLSKSKGEFELTTVRFGELLPSAQILLNAPFLEHNLFAAFATRNLNVDDCHSIDEDVVQILGLLRNPMKNIDVSSDRLQFAPQVRQQAS
jgi:hypothetical protein